MNSVIKVTENMVVDIMIVRAISYNEAAKQISVYFMRHDTPVVGECEYDDYLNLYTKWRNHTEWRLNLALGEYDNA